MIAEVERATQTPATRRVRVLFMQSQSYFGSDSMMHSLLMRNYDRAQAEVHVACNRGQGSLPSASLKALSTIPDVKLRPTNFGPTLNSVPTRKVVASVPSAFVMSADLLALAAYIRRQRIDVIHGTEKPRDAFYGVILAKLTGAKSVVHLHVKCDDWMSAKVRWAMARADAIVGVSRFVAESAIAKGYRRQKLHWILNGIDASRWDPDLDGTPVRREFGIEPDQVVLAITARMFHWKGHLSLVRALAKLGSDTPRFRLLVVGEDDPRGAPGRGSLTAELKALVTELGMEQKVILTGFRSDIPLILAACDIYAMPTFEEPCAVAFLEAMAMRKPIVALNSGGTPEIVEKDICGLLSEPEDIEALASNLHRLINDAGLRSRLGAAGRKRVETVLTPGRMAQEGLEVYRQTLANGPTPSSSAATI
jgi:glycosyltransferase involved in cell wall biosynthesis